jgi:predicted RNA polymerase sigma factor
LESDGVPRSPGGWLTTVARNRALDLARRDATLHRSLPLLLDDQTMPAPDEVSSEEIVDAVHSDAPSWHDTDWAEVVALYDLLVALWPSPVVALNRAVAVGFAAGPAAGLAALDALTAEPQLAGYGYLTAARAGLLAKLGRTTEARTCYEEALLLTENTVERDFLTDRLSLLSNP